MKLLYRFLAIGLLSIAATITAYADSGCGNKSYKGPSPCPCKECGDPYAGDPFDPYTGNEFREVRDLQVWGVVGEIPLEFMRFAHSRYSAYPRPFGLAHHWNHSFHYTMYDDGVDDQGRARIIIHFPRGEEYMYTQDAANQSLWLPLPGVDNRLFQQGTNFFLQMANGHRYRFEKLVDPGGNVWPYESNSNVYYQLQDIRDSYQNLYTLTYNSDHWLTRITEPAGRFLQITYGFVNGWRVITQVSTSDGRSVRYNYDLFHDEVHSWIRDWVRLVSVDYGDGTQAQYNYWQSEPGKGPNLEHAIDPRYTGANVNMRFTYNMSITEGYIKEEKNGKTGEVMVTLNTTSGNRWVCYANGRVQHFEMPDELAGRTKVYIDGLGRSLIYEWDMTGLGFVKNRTDALGRTTSYIKTIYGNPSEITYPDGSKEKWTRDDLDQILTYTDALNGVTTYTRDNRHLVTRVRYPDGTAERFTYNSFSQVLTHTLRNGAIESYTYDSRGLKTLSKNAIGNLTRYTYDGADRLASVIDARGNITKYEYNERGLLTTLTNADNSFQTYTYDDYGNRNSTTNELGNSWIMVFDEFKRIVSSKDPLNRETQYKFDLPGGGCGCSHDNNAPTKIILPSGKISTITYDVEWQKLSETKGAGSFDAATTNYEYDEDGNLVTVVDPRGKSWTYDYDVRNRMVSSTDPLGNTTGTSYDVSGNVLTKTRADSGTMAYQYDEMNRQTQVIDPKGQVTKIKYDNEGNMTRLTDAIGRNYTFDYDALNRETRMAYPGSRFESYLYDVVGNMIRYTNRAGDVCTYTYDNRNRETTSTWSDNTPAIIATYDAADRLLTLSSNISMLTYTYNEADELTSETQAIAGTGGGAKTVSYSYNADGLTNTVGYPGNSTVVNYDYTARNYVKTITASGMSNVVTNYNYDLNGNRVAKAYNNGTGTAYTYDSGNRIEKVDNQKAGMSFDRYDYGYDAVNRRIHVKRDNNRGDVYAYDTTDQVTNVQYEVTNPEGVASSPLRTVSYDWDAVGNRASVVDDGIATSYITNNHNEYTNIGGNLITYNTNGNLRTFDGWTYGYDAQNRLIRAEKGDTLVRFAYDARNRRVKQTINAEVSYLYYSGWNLVQETNSAGRTLVEYMHGAQVDELLCKTSSSKIMYYHYDALGSVTQLTNINGNIVERYTYDIFSKATIRNADGDTILLSAGGNRFLFTGREIIQQIGLYDYRNRMYSPELGRFLQSDPLRFGAEDVNLYRYVGNSPVNSNDPSGLRGQEPIFIEIFGGDGSWTGSWSGLFYWDCSKGYSDVDPNPGFSIGTKAGGTFVLWGTHLGIGYEYLYDFKNRSGWTNDGCPSGCERYAVSLHIYITKKLVLGFGFTQPNRGATKSKEFLCPCQKESSH